MKLIPNKGYVALKKSENISTSMDGLTRPMEYTTYDVVAVSEDTPLCKVGDTVVLYDVDTYFGEYVIAKEDNVMAWVEDY